MPCAQFLLARGADLKGLLDRKLSRVSTTRDTLARGCAKRAPEWGQRLLSLGEETPKEERDNP